MNSTNCSRKNSLNGDPIATGKPSMLPTRTAAGTPPSPPNAWMWLAAGSGSWPCAAPPGASVDLKVRAEQVAGRVTGLLETLCLVEVDLGRNVALLRSEQPGQRGDERFYYEVLLEGDGGSALRRYQTPRPGEPRRQQVAFTLTHEALAKLVGDLSA